MLTASDKDCEKEPGNRHCRNAMVMFFKIGQIHFRSIENKAEKYTFLKAIHFRFGAIFITVEYFLHLSYMYF